MASALLQRPPIEVSAFQRHVLLECAGLSAVRQRYAPLFGSTASMRDFVWQQDVVLLAKFIAECEAAVQQALSGVAG